MSSRRLLLDGVADVYEVPSGWEWSTIPARSADGSHSARTFASKKREVAVQIGTDRVVRGSNAPLGLPEAEIRTGGWELEGWAVGESLNLHDMLVWQSINADGIKITRIPDNDDDIQFSIDL